MRAPGKSARTRKKVFCIDRDRTEKHYEGDPMGKEQNTKKEVKRKPAKTLKEKRKEKQAKKASKQ
jgi:hypothetical protein